MLTRFIGDVHGKFRQYKRIIAGCDRSVQVGDMGVGFLRRDMISGEARPTENPPYDHMTRGDHRFIRGNHDSPAVCESHSQWITDGAVEEGVMYIGGALSVDREWRTEGLDWWIDEELSTAELNHLVGVYAETKPRAMITHECPESHAELLMALSGRRKLDFPSRTRQAFQSMIEIHRPQIWIHGHWHISFDNVLDGTRFVCLAELEFKDIGL